MSIKSYQHFNIERPNENELIVRKNTKNGLLVTVIMSIGFITFSGAMLFVSKGAGAIGGFFIFFCALAISFNALSEARKKKVHIFDKSKDLILLNAKALLRLSQVSFVELYSFVASDDNLETYRVVVVSEEMNMGYKIFEAEDEYDMRRLAEAISEFMDVQLKERHDPQK
jgi:hypothetical protein